MVTSASLAPVPPVVVCALDESSNVQYNFNEIVQITSPFSPSQAIYPIYSVPAINGCARFNSSVLKAPVVGNYSLEFNSSGMLILVTNWLIYNIYRFNQYNRHIAGRCWYSCIIGIHNDATCDYQLAPPTTA